MRKLIAAAVIAAFFSFTPFPDGKGWVSLFDGESLDGWKVGANAASFSVENGAIVVNGNVSHLFYDGPVEQHTFRDFELKAHVMTTPGSNSGIYIHSQFQENGWPQKGYEVQVNNSHTDWRRTGSLWAIQDIKTTYVNDNEWFTLHIKVEGKRITVKINGRQVVDYTEPEDPPREEGLKGRLLSSGTIALQGHDPKSKVYYKNILVKTK